MKILVRDGCQNIKTGVRKQTSEIGQNRQLPQSQDQRLESAHHAHINTLIGIELFVVAVAYCVSMFKVRIHCSLRRNKPSAQQQRRVLSVDGLICVPPG